MERQRAGRYKDVISITRTVVWCAVAVLLLLAAPGIVSAGQLSGDTTPKLSGAALVKELQKGGHVIYFRHGTTAESGEKDVADADLDDCARQRNLSDAGQTQTKEIGAAFKVLRIPVGEVYNSPYCRCVDTARNLFGKGAKNKALHFAIQVRSAERASITTQLLDLLATVPPQGTNTALVSHTANLQEAVGLWPKPEGVAHIFKPRGDGTFSYVGVMQPETWIVEAKRSPDGGQASPGLLNWLRGR
jgi:phosphohistidine phosphatase SixA